MIDLLPDDPCVFLELAISRPVSDIFLFSFPVPISIPVLEQIARDNVVRLTRRSSIEFALQHSHPEMAVVISFDGGTQIGQLLGRYVAWEGAGRPR
jgi:hypothetical protein